MDQSDSDWGDWSLNDQGDIDAMIDEYKHTTTKADGILGGDDSVSNDYSLYDEDLSGSGDSDDSMDDVQSFSLQKNNHYNGVPAVYRNGQPQYEYSYPEVVQEGMAICEFCGRRGVKHAFYSKSKRFCTMACSRTYSASQKDKKNPSTGLKMSRGKKMKTGSNIRALKSMSQGPSSQSFNWSEFFAENNVPAASVSCFKHCPMSDCWDNITTGMKVEVLNKDCDLPNDVYWIATVIKVAGYKAQMRYEGFGNDPSLDYWVNLCTQDVHPVGWCATHKKPLVPPQTIQNKYSDWKDVLVKRLTGARTLPNNFYNKVVECVNVHPIKKGMRVEVVDKMCVSAMRVATADEIIGGRLRLQYEDARGPNDDFWCHRESALVHAVGWAQLVGHKLHSTPDYKSQSLNKIMQNKYTEMDGRPDMFAKKLDPPSSNGLKFEVGMKLEAIDPLNLSTICVASVMKVLRNNYLMIGIDGSMAVNGSDWFCYHATSPCIFPVGFCEINQLALSPPRGYKGEFRWFDYLKQTKSIAAPVKLFDKVNEIPKHGFKPRMKVEAVDLMEPRLICVGTVVRVVGRLLRIHFDGWESSYDQWVDCESPDIYPAGWCEMVGYLLEGPKPRPIIEPMNISLPNARKRKTKSQVYRGPRKKRKPKTQLPPPLQQQQQATRTKGCTPQSSFDLEDLSQSSNSTTDSIAGAQGGSSIQTSNSTADGMAVQPGFSTTQTDFKVKLEEPNQTKPNMEASFYSKLKTATKEKNNISEKEVSSTNNQVAKEMPTLSPPMKTQSVRPSSSDVPPLLDTAANPENVANSSLSRPVVVRPPVSSPSTMSALAMSLQQQPPPNVTLTASSVRSFASAPMSTIAAVLKTGSPTRGHLPLPGLNTTPPMVGSVRTSQPGSSICSPSQHKMTLPLTTTSALPAFTSQAPAQQQHQQATAVSNVHTESTVSGQFSGVQPGPSKHIPRVVPGEPDKDVPPFASSHEQAITPDLWGVHDVCQFLRINDCGAYCDSFSKKNIFGKKFMTLTKEQIVNLTGMKVGPSLKIYDLIQQLKITVASQLQKQVVSPPGRQPLNSPPHIAPMHSNKAGGGGHRQLSPVQSPQQHRVLHQSPALQQLMSSPPQSSQSMALKAQLSQPTEMSLS